jgi:hypothetical protein
VLTRVLLSATVITVNKRGTTLLALQIVKKISTSFGMPEGFITVPKGLSGVPVQRQNGEILNSELVISKTLKIRT